MLGQQWDSSTRGDKQYLLNAEYVRRSLTSGEGIVLDFDADGHLIGIEITAPSCIRPAEINDILQRYNLAPLSNDDLAPLRAA